MSMLVQKLGCLRGAYSALLRLGCDSGNHQHWVLGTVTKCKRSIQSAASIYPNKAHEFVIPSNVTSKITDNPERISENTYAHNLFLNSLKYKNIVVQPITTYGYILNKEALEILQQDWNSMTSAETVAAIKKLSYNICNSDNRKIDSIKYEMVFNTLNMQNLTDDDLITMMRHLIPFNYMDKCSSYINFCLRINRECMTRFTRVPAEKMLYLCDIIYQMTPNIAYKLYSQYTWYSIRHLGHEPQKLSPQQLVQILFFLNIYRKPSVNIYELEYQLERCMNELSINELAIAALGFFKTSTQIRNKDFVNRIIKKTIKEIDVVDTISIAAIVKLVGFSMTLREIKMFMKLLKVLTPFEPRYTLITLSHIAHTCAKITMYDKEFIDRMIARLNRETKTARLKDFERFIFMFTSFNIDSSNSVYQNVIEELRATWDTTRAFEIEKFPHGALLILGYLAIQNIYPIDLIKRVMASEYVNKIDSYFNLLPREYCVLDYGLRTEVPEYDGPFLKPAMCNFVQQKYYNWFLKTGSAESTRANVLFTNVLATCRELFNTTSDILGVRVLPHFTAQDIVFCIDEQNQLVPSEKFFSQFESHDLKPVDKENSNNLRWIALVTGHHGLLIRNCQTPTGAAVAKMRQLSVLGYTPFLISHISWEPMSPQEKLEYIKKLVFRDNASKLSNVT